MSPIKFPCKFPTRHPIPMSGPRPISTAAKAKMPNLSRRIPRQSYKHSLRVENLLSPHESPKSKALAGSVNSCNSHCQKKWGFETSRGARRFTLSPVLILPSAETYFFSLKDSSYKGSMSSVLSQLCDLLTAPPFLQQWVPCLRKLRLVHQGSYLALASHCWLNQDLPSLNLSFPIEPSSSVHPAA